MKIRTKLILLSCVFSVGILMFAGLGIVTWNRINAINDSIEKGIEMQVRSRDVHSLMKDMVFDLFVPKIYGQLKSYTYSPRTTVTVKKWKSAVYEYQSAFYAFMATESLLNIKDAEMLDQYDTAYTMHERAMSRLEQLDDSITMISEQMSSVDEDRFDEILGEDTFIPFFEEFRDTSYYFVDSFESFMNYFIEEFRVYGYELQHQIYVIYGFLTFCIAAFGITFSLVTSKDIITKIHHVEDAFARVSRGDFSVRMHVKGHDEFCELANQFNSLSLDLKENVDNILRLTRAVGGSIASGTSMEALLQIVVRTIVQETHADAAFIHFVGTDPSKTGRTVLKIRSVEGDLTGIDPEHVGVDIGTVLNDGEPIVLRGEELPEQLSALSSLMVFPLVIEKEVIGTLTVVIHQPAPPFTDLGVTRLSTFAEFASLTLDNHFKYSDLIKKGEAEYQALQSQVQPHFIYNILNGFIGLNRMGDKKSLESSIIELKEMLRYTQDSRTVTTISEELSFIENYCQLQKLRFGDRFEYTLHLGDGLGGVKIPRLLLQPIAENAIIHGIEPLQDRVGSLEVEAFYTLEDRHRMISIVIRDNGVGFDLETLHEKEHIGIGSVRRRFKYAFPNSAFNIKSSPGEGTEIRMTFHEMYHS